MATPPQNASRGSDSNVDLAQAAGPCPVAPLPKNTSLGANATMKMHLRWLHIPKTGTFFIRPLIAFSCPQFSQMQVIRAGQGAGLKDCGRYLKPGHPPFVSDAHPCGYLTNLRDPLVRIASGFVHGFHDCPSMGNIGNRNNNEPLTIQKSLRACRNLTDDIVLAYANCVSGFMTRMLAGASCGGKGENVTDDQEQLANKRLAQMAFVGITDDWKASIKCFLARFPNRLKDDGFFVEHHENPSPSSDCRNRVLSVLHRHNFTDATDMRLYEKALQRHQSTCRITRK